MSTNPTISVVIPAYNREESILAAVQSVLAQDFTNLELIVVDDASTDGTADRLASLNDPRLRIVSHERNLGAAAARNTGVRAAQAEWIAFQDSDDEWLPGKLRRQMERLTAPDADFIAGYCGMILIGRHFQSSNERPQVLYIPNPKLETVRGNILPQLLEASLVSTQTLVIRRGILELAGGFDEALPALIDWECMLRVAQLGAFDFIDEPLVLQRFSPNSITRDAKRQICARSQILAKHSTLFSAHPQSKSLQYRSLAGALRRIGEYAQARRALSEARRVNPHDDWRLWALSAAMIVPRLLPNYMR